MNSPMPRVSRLLLCAASHFLAGRGGAAGAAGEKNFRDVRIQAVVCAVSPAGRELVLAYDFGRRSCGMNFTNYDLAAANFPRRFYRFSSP